uniref:hypothetical protein n=1 Tax=Ornithobacterium rhinotracheale TaxID=28251 RepID=UPI0039A62B12
MKTLYIKSIDGCTDFQDRLLHISEADTVLVTYGIKKSYDDDFVKDTATGCAKLLKTKAYGIKTGKEFISVMENAGRIAAYVNWGHSWDSGLYLTNNNGFYIDSYDQGGGPGDTRLKDLSKSKIKTRKHTLFIFASCGTAGAFNVEFKKSFAYTFANFINKVNEVGSSDGVWDYKVTTIGATDLSNLFWKNEYNKGKIQCLDGSFKKIEKLFRITNISYL